MQLSRCVLIGRLQQLSALYCREVLLDGLQQSGIAKCFAVLLFLLDTPRAEIFVRLDVLQRSSAAQRTSCRESGKLKVERRSVRFSSLLSLRLFPKLQKLRFFARRKVVCSSCRLSLDRIVVIVYSRDGQPFERVFEEA